MPADHLTDPGGRPEFQRWFHASVRFPDWATAERIVADLIGPRLDAVTASAGCGWWFLRKHPCWRIRISGTNPSQAAELLSQFAGNGIIDSWHQEIYEPEEHAFGGSAGMAIAHDMFCADSRGVLDYARLDAPPIGRREMSMLLIGALLAGGRLDQFERGDVFAQIARTRPAPREDIRDKLARLTGQLRVLTSIPAAEAITNIGLFSAGTRWPDAFTDAGRKLGDAARAGRLERGLRAVLTHMVIFHWNRLGLPAATQGILARAATEVYLPANDP